MNFTLRAVPPNEFAQWVDRGATGRPDARPRRLPRLAQQSSNVAPFTYQAVDPDLFHAVVDAADAARRRPASGARRQSASTEAE